MLELNIEDTLYTIKLNKLDIKLISIILNVFFMVNDLNYDIRKIDEIPKENLDLFLLKESFDNDLKTKSECLNVKELKNEKKENDNSIVCIEIYGEYILQIYKILVKSLGNSSFSNYVNTYIGLSCLKSLIESLEKILGK